MATITLGYRIPSFILAIFYWHALPTLTKNTAAAFQSFIALQELSSRKNPRKIPSKVSYKSNDK